MTVLELAIVLCGALAVVIGLALLTFSGLRLRKRSRFTAAGVTLNVALCLVVPALGILLPRHLLASYSNLLDIDVRDFFAQSASSFEVFVWTLFFLTGAALVVNLLHQTARGAPRSGSQTT